MRWPVAWKMALQTAALVPTLDDQIIGVLLAETYEAAREAAHRVSPLRNCVISLANVSWRIRSAP